MKLKLLLCRLLHTSYGTNKKKFYYCPKCNTTQKRGQTFYAK